MQQMTKISLVISNSIKRTFYSANFKSTLTLCCQASNYNDLFLLRLFPYMSMDGLINRGK